MKTKIFKSIGLSLALMSVLATSAFASNSTSPKYDIQYTKDTISVNKAASPLGGVGTTAVAQFSYDGTFSHIIYSSTATSVTSGNTLYVTGKQRSTNTTYPNLNIQYTFVSKGSNPASDILLTGTTYSTAGSATADGDYNLSFYINAQANNTLAYLRAWNYNNLDGGSTTKTIHTWGTVSK
jgi:hypothetical protein